jgi:hypothetical protein
LGAADVGVACEGCAILQYGMVTVLEASLHFATATTLQ